MNSVIVRKMKISDIDKVLEIENECFSTPWSKDAFITELTKNKLAKYFVAEVNGEVVAYGGMWLIVDEAHITNIAVNHKYRGMGIGTKVVKNLIQEGKNTNICRMTLEVRKTNLNAQELYKKLGFIFSGIRPKYYQDNNEDAIIMWKDII